MRAEDALQLYADRRTYNNHGVCDWFVYLRFYMLWYEFFLVFRLLLNQCWCFAFLLWMWHRSQLQANGDMLDTGGNWWLVLLGLRSSYLRQDTESFGEFDCMIRCLMTMWNLLSQNLKR
jgi:hypothetical protein